MALSEQPIVITLCSADELTARGLHAMVARSRGRLELLNPAVRRCADVRLCGDIGNCAHRDPLTGPEIVLPFRSRCRPDIDLVFRGCTLEQLIAGVTEAVAAVGQLSARERQILTLIGRGLSNEQITKELFISQNTVKAYIRSAYGKIGATSRSHAVRWSVRYGLSRPQRWVRTRPERSGGGNSDGEPFVALC